MDMYMFGSRLKALRESRNISADELAKAIGVNKATVHRYETGYFKSIKMDKLEGISKFLNVSINYLTGEADYKYFNKTIDLVFDTKPTEISDILNISLNMLNQDNISNNGKPVKQDDINSLIKYIEFILETSKKED